MIMIHPYLLTWGMYGMKNLKVYVAVIFEFEKHLTFIMHVPMHAGASFAWILK